jgi:hypothetical protein
MGLHPEGLRPKSMLKDGKYPAHWARKDWYPGTGKTPCDGCGHIIPKRARLYSVVIPGEGRTSYVGECCLPHDAA